MGFIGEPLVPTHGAGYFIDLTFSKHLLFQDLGSGSDHRTMVTTLPGIAPPDIPNTADVNRSHSSGALQPWFPRDSWVCETPGRWTRCNWILQLMTSPASSRRQSKWCDRPLNQAEATPRGGQRPTQRRTEIWAGAPARKTGGASGGGPGGETKILAPGG
ncbi:hypothetical protein BJX66DRAFT_32042 [Aspergillus keveii]|uniref:Uncharacterized protein n=1 Tax=Aspergillus keveii TaxID=714993 RepID=A0ABR4FSZ7_9EURO